MWIKHPTEDLAILPVNPIIQNVIKKQQRDPFLIYFDESLIPSKDLVEEIDAIEDILMVGYPHGFWDEKNNLPIVRKGLTATPFYLNYNKEPHFLIDIPIYPGSSGSPVILFNQGSYSSRRGGLVVGSRIALLGINVQSINYNALGELAPQSGAPRIPTYTNLPFNIAVVIKSSELASFRPILQSLVRTGR